MQFPAEVPGPFFYVYSGIFTFIIVFSLALLYRNFGRERAHFFWTIAFTSEFFRYLILSFFVSQNEPVSYMLHYIFYSVFGTFIVAGSLSFTGRTPSNRLLAILVSTTLTIALLADFFLDNDALAELIIFFYSGGGAIAAGIILLNRKPEYPRSHFAITALTLILLGAHKIDFPFLKHVRWFVPYGFLLNQFLLIMLALNLFIISLRRQQWLNQTATRFIEDLTEASPGVVYVYDWEKNNNIYANQRFSTLLGYTPEEFRAAGLPIQEYVHPEDREKYMTFVNQLLQATDNDIFSVDMRFRTKNDSYRWLYLQEKCFRRNSEGQVWQTLGVAQDITETRNMELALQAARIDLEETFTNLPLGVIVLSSRNESYAVENINIKARSVLDLPDLTPDFSLTDLFDRNPDLGKHLEKLRDMINHRGNPERAEFEIGNKILEFTVFRQHNRQIVILVNDITLNRRLQRELLRTADHQRLQIGQNLHDGLGQHLTGIALFLSSLARKADSLGLKDQLGKDIENISNLVTETNQKMRILARGLAPLSVGHLDLSEAVSQCLRDAERLLSLRTEFEDNLAEDIRNPDIAINVFYILQEFINNAVRHGNADFVKVRITEDLNRLFIQISDNSSFEKASPLEKVGMGIRTMRYRSEILGGSFILERSAGNSGAIARISLPKSPSVRINPQEKMSIFQIDIN